MSLVLTEVTTSISDLKKNPMQAVKQGEGFPVAVLNRNKTAFYCVPAEAYEAMMEKLEDIELAEIVKQREDMESVAVNIDDL